MDNNTPIFSYKGYSPYIDAILEITHKPEVSSEGYEYFEAEIYDTECKGNVFFISISIPKHRLAYYIEEKKIITELEQKYIDSECFVKDGLHVRLH